MRQEPAEIGIITFHCSNNAGALLQAYGLKAFLRRSGKPADIIRYEPFYMTGRHWLIPYVPVKPLKNMWYGFWRNWRIKEDFSQQLQNMNRFRYQYLVDRNERKIRSLAGLRRLNYRCYVVGSDQIWNPDITFGLRRAYFGAFPNRRKKKVISYAASIGGAALPGRYDGEFSRLVRCLDAVSVREKAAVPYVERLYGGAVTAVLDPVFFLEKEAWQEVERTPDRAKGRSYILVYDTEQSEEMSDYAEKLSRKTGLPIIELSAGQPKTGAEAETDRTAGPAELLGYIHQASYVVSNSFHAVAFSIIYEKQFLAFLHSCRGERVKNIIDLHGLQDRLYEPHKPVDIDAGIDWEAVWARTRENVSASGEFLLRHLRE